MPLTVDAWIPNAGNDGAAARAIFFTQPYKLSPGSLGPGADPLVEVPGNIDILKDPLDNTKWCLRTVVTAQNIIDWPGGTKSTINPITPTNSDPICDWAGSAAVRRWYRLAFMVLEMDPVLQVRGSPSAPGVQLTVVWQLHDEADTSPADVIVEPPLWIIEDGNGFWSFRRHYDVNPQTAHVTVVRKELTKIPIRFGVWEEIVIYMKPSWTSGEMIIWHNGNRIYEDTGTPNCFNNLPARGGSYNFIEYGVYSKGGQTKTRTVYHKGMQIGTESYATYNDFMVACGSSNRERLVHPRRAIPVFGW